MLIAYPYAGLANRLRVLASVHRAARLLNRPFAMYWRRTRDCGCRFRDLFENEFMEIDPKNTAHLGRVTILRDQWQHETLCNRVGNSIPRYYHPYTLLIHSCCFVALTDEKIGGGPVPPGFLQEVSAFHRALRPVQEVRQRVEAFAREHWAPRIFGVHVRRTDNKWSRNMSRDENFIRAMERIIDTVEGARFFLATDCPRVEQRMRERFGDRVVTYPKRTPLVDTDRVAPCRGTVEGMQDALVDMLLLSHTAYVLGSRLSTFSQAAGYFSGRLDQVRVV